MIASAGNDRTSIVSVISPACGYNSIAVGTYEATGVSKLERMLKYKYAPIDGTSTPCYKPDVVVASGSTSGAAPALSGVVAMIMEAKPSLKSHPEVIKAIIMASCHRKILPYEPDNLDGATQNEVADIQEYIEYGLTEKQGAGAFDAYRALKIAIEGTYGEITTIAATESTVKRFTLSHEDDVNVSIAWHIDNTYQHKDNLENLSSPDDIYDITTRNFQELELRVYDGNEILCESTKLNAGKQMVYMKGLLPNKTYRIAVNKVDNDYRAVTYGYAWSGKNYVQAEMDIQGDLIVGKTLTANLTYIDGKTVTNGEASYIWKNSDDGNTWTNITGATEQTYVLTNSDVGKHIKCEATLADDTLSGAVDVSSATDLVIIRYGDVDLDGVVCPLDATEVQLYLSNMRTLSEEQLIAADVDGDGFVSNLDAVLIQKYTLNMLTSFPVEE